MIFVVLGTQKIQLNRLLEIIDKAIKNGEITDKVIAQIGNSSYIAKNFDTVDFMDKAAFDETIKNADLVITHSRVGSIITALNEKNQ